jgi:hypothetical protein
VVAGESKFRDKKKAALDICSERDLFAALSPQGEDSFTDAYREKLAKKAWTKITAKKKASSDRPDYSSEDSAAAAGGGGGGGAAAEGEAGAVDKAGDNITIQEQDSGKGLGFSASKKPRSASKKLSAAAYRKAAARKGAKPC